MHITLRERDIIQLLLLHPDGITVSEIAKQLDVSQRTVHRELKNVATTLLRHEMFLEKKAGVGLFVQGTSEKRSELKISLLRQTTEFTSKEREELILLTLLKSTDAIKLVALANDFDVTTRTISQDLDHIGSYLQAFGITLTRKRGRGISLEATEQQKRNALGYFLAMQFNEYEFLEILKDPEPNKNRFLEIIKMEKLVLADKLIREMMEDHDLQLTDHAHMTLTIHLSLAIQRVVQGEIITMDEALLAELQQDEKYGIAKEIATVMEDVFNIEIPTAELGYITIHLKGARLHAALLNSTSIHTSACRSLIRYVSQKLNVAFEEDPSVLEGLLKHIEPAVYRLERGLDLYNPLTTKIMTEYPRLFQATKEGLEKYFSGLIFPDGEIAYVVLYFGGSSILYDAKKEVTLAVICPSGLGSSKMLTSRIEKEITGVNVTTFSLGELNFNDVSTFDLVLSTVEIADYPDEYLLISPILTEAEIAVVGQEVKRYAGKTEEVLLERAYQKDKKKLWQFDVKEEFQTIRVFSDLVIKLLAQFSVETLPVTKGLDVMGKMLEVMYEKQLITDIEGVRSDLKEREQLGGFGIPGTEVAFYHCRTASVKEPVFNVFRLSERVVTLAMDKSKVDVASILLVLAPMEVAEAELAVLSAIGEAVIEDATAIFTTGSRAEMEKQLGDVFYEKFKLMVK